MALEVKSNSPFLRFLFCILSICYVESFSFNGYEIRDLESTSSSLETEAQAWQITNKLISTSTTKCGSTWILGGYGSVGTYGNFSRTYTLLPSHNIIYFSFNVWLIDLQETTNLFQLYIDGQMIKQWNVVSYGSWGGTQICGGSRNDYNTVFIEGQAQHSSNQLTIEFASLFQSGTNHFSLGFRDLSILFQTTTPTPTTSVCDFNFFSSSSPSCLCGKGKFNVAGSGSCTSCDAACSTCFGTSASNCTSCKSGYSFNGQTCVLCHSTCNQCNGTTQTDCTKCDSGEFLYWNGTCQSSCNSPLTVRTVGDVQYCDPQSANSTNTTTNSSSPSSNSTSNTSTNTSSSSNNTSVNNNTNTNTNNDTSTSNNTSSNTTTSRSEYIGAALDTIAQGASAIGGVLRSSNSHSGFMISLVKLVKYVRYVQVPINPDIRSILESNASGIFSVSTMFTFSMPQSLQNSFNKHKLPTPFENQVNHSSYLVNHWDTISNYVILSALGIFCRILEKLSERTNNKIFIAAAKRLRILTQWNFVLCVAFNTFDDLTFFAILELESLTFDGAASIISFIACILVTCCALYILIKLFLISLESVKIKGQKVDDHFTDHEKAFYKKWENYQVIYSGYKNKSFITQAYLFWFTCRVILTYLIVGVLYNCPVIQAIHFTALSVLMLTYLIKLRPLNDPFSLFVSITFEVMVLTVNVCVSCLAILDAAGSLTTGAQDGFSKAILFANTSIDTFGNIVSWMYVLLAIWAAYKTSKRPGLAGKTNWLAVFTAPYQNPGEDFNELSNHDTLDSEPIAKKRFHQQYQTPKKNRIHVQGLAHTLKLNLEEGDISNILRGQKLTTQSSGHISEKIKSINLVKYGFRHNKKLSTIYPVSPESESKIQLEESPEGNASTTRLCLKSPNNYTINLLEPSNNSRQFDISTPGSHSSDTKRLFLNNTQTAGEKQYRARMIRHGTRQTTLDYLSQTNLPAKSIEEIPNLFNYDKRMTSTENMTGNFVEDTPIANNRIRKSSRKEELGASDISLILGPPDSSLSEIRKNRFSSQDEIWGKDTTDRNDLKKVGTSHSIKRSSFQRMATAAGLLVLEPNSKILRENSTQLENDETDKEYGPNTTNKERKEAYSERRSLITKLFFRKKV